MAKSRSTSVKPDKPPPTAATPSVNVVRSSSYHEVYANALRIRVSPIDFTITFGNMADIPGISTPLVQDQSSITMTMTFAKVLLEHLQGIMSAIENELGTIKVPEKNKLTDAYIQSVINVLRENPWM